MFVDVALRSIFGLASPELNSEDDMVKLRTNYAPSDRLGLCKSPISTLQQEIQPCGKLLCRRHTSSRIILPAVCYDEVKSNYITFSSPTLYISHQ